MTPDTALRLERVTGMGADFWLGLQQDRDPWQALAAECAAAVGGRPISRHVLAARTCCITPHRAVTEGCAMVTMRPRRQRRAPGTGRAGRDGSATEALQAGTARAGMAAERRYR